MVFLQGNDITLVARQPWQRRQQGSRETQQFEVVFKEVSGSQKLLVWCLASYFPRAARANAMISDNVFF